MKERFLPSFDEDRRVSSNRDLACFTKVSDRDRAVVSFGREQRVNQMIHHFVAHLLLRSSLLLPGRYHNLFKHEQRPAALAFDC